LIVEVKSNEQNLSFTLALNYPAWFVQKTTLHGELTRWNKE